MQIDISNLIKAHETLKTAYDFLKNNQNSQIQSMLEDSCAKRFEYTLETARKLIKKILKKNYAKDEIELTVNNTFRFAQGYNFISNWTNWRNYWEKRNNTAHEYNLEKSREVIVLIPDFLKDTQELINNLKAFLC